MLSLVMGLLSYRSVLKTCTHTQGTKVYHSPRTQSYKPLLPMNLLMDSSIYIYQVNILLKY